ncbi:CGNR zinc finger domain-containing protein [Brevibacterium album]|uniref:CGNR zinc finger domain-containing protein n=1 Tax=Brevibacterium album TaxID=417948 RepID=UPI0003FA0C3B|nr:ABATE domain-containing protein [Brevibacterium album]
MKENAHAIAPGAAEHQSLALVNSVSASARGLHDDLDSPEAARAWLLARDLIGPDIVIREYCRKRIIALREDLRELFIAHTGGSTPSPEAVEGLNRALTSAPGALLLRFDPPAGFTRSADHPVTQAVEHAMALLAEDAAALLTGREASMLASCGAEGCLWFCLRTHARRQWCSTRCGDRVRAARAYARRRAQREGQTG